MLLFMKDTDYIIALLYMYVYALICLGRGNVGWLLFDQAGIPLWLAVARHMHTLTCMQSCTCAHTPTPGAIAWGTRTLEVLMSYTDWIGAHVWVFENNVHIKHQWALWLMQWQSLRELLIKIIIHNNYYYVYELNLICQWITLSQKERYRTS